MSTENFTLPDIKVLQKMTDEELASYGVKKDKNGKLRNMRGQYIPGQSGLIKKGKLAEPKKNTSRTMNDLIPEDIRKKFGNDPLKCLQEMLKLATTKSEATRISKELLPYTHPKLASVEQKTFNFNANNILVEWQDDNNDYKVIEHESSTDSQDSLSGNTDFLESGDDRETVIEEDREDN